MERQIKLGGLDMHAFLLKSVALGFTLLLTLGCTIRMVDFTAISTKNVKIPTVAKGNRVTGEDCIPVILIPLGIPNMKEAIDRAIESAGPDFDALVDGVVYHQNYSFLFGQVCYVVEGTPINTKTSVSMLDIAEKPIMFHSFHQSKPLPTS